jgi:natural product precursor
MKQLSKLNLVNLGRDELYEREMNILKGGSTTCSCSMVYIITQKFDVTTDSVIDWLIYYNVPYKRINSYVYESHKFHYTITLDKNEEELTDVLWIRKPSYDGKANYIHNEVNKGLYEVADWRFKKVIGSFNHIYNLNKLKNLKLAQNLGLLIPPTIVTNNKLDLLEFINKNGEIITKPCSDMIPLTIDKTRYYQYTSIVTDEVISQLPDVFCVSLFQKHIKKTCDIKTFYFNRTFFSQAIFSQSSDQTSIDFRKYDESNPNRVCPFKLPEDIEHKTIKLMDLLNEEVGTIDFILSGSNEFYFLEINPNGEFLNLSQNCNYPICKHISEFLKHNHYTS